MKSVNTVTSYLFVNVRMDKVQFSEQQVLDQKREYLKLWQHAPSAIVTNKPRTLP